MAENALVAQLDRATDFESVGRTFEPCQAHVFYAGQDAKCALSYSVDNVQNHTRIRRFSISHFRVKLFQSESFRNRFATYLHRYSNAHSMYLSCFLTLKTIEYSAIRTLLFFSVF